MKRFPIKALLFLPITLLLFTMNSNSQPTEDPYKKLWKKVEDHIENRLPKSALEETEKIYQLAKSESKDAQIVKALIRIASLKEEIREYGDILAITDLEKELPHLKEPARSIMQSHLATQYWNYFQNKRWIIYDRTATANFIKEDIATWSTEDFHEQITSLYLSSLRSEELLKQTRLDDYDAIITKGNMRHLRPTLFDLLAHRAIAYFKNDEIDIEKPAYAFEINQASAFDPAADFIRRKFETKDSLSLQHKALLLYQQLIAFHLSDAKPDALIDVDLQRIQFVYENATHPQKEELYFNAINHIAHQYNETPAAAQAWYLLANYYAEKGNSYEPFGDTTHRYAKVKAKEIAEKILLQKDSSEGKINAHNLLLQLNKPNLSFAIEKVNVPLQPFRVYVDYKNIPTLYLRLIKTTKPLQELMDNSYKKEFWPTLTAAKSEKSWQQVLPATNDLQEHGVEIKVDGLPVGEYILLVSNSKNFSSNEDIIGARYFYVSNIALVNNDRSYFILNRESGLPITNASATVWQREYSYPKQQYISHRTGKYTTDHNGQFNLHQENRYTNNSYQQFEIKAGKDYLYIKEYAYTYFNNDTKPSDKKTLEGFLFGDRSLYRPGQTVYFKGIIIEKDSKEKNNTVKSEYKTTVYLRNANHQIIDSVKVKTNEYGSFNSSFVLPSSGLNGSFTLQLNKISGSLYFNVEEYKRPKFFVELDKATGTYQVNDTIEITGTAKAYAGNNITGAKVKYRVVREPRFLYPWYFWRSWQPPVSPMEITHGEVITDENGKFTIPFKAIPDLSLDKKTDPVFDYKVHVDVTDINGETRSGSSITSVSYKSIVIDADIPAKAYSNELDTVHIRTQNINGSFEAAKIDVAIFKLKEEKRLIRDRFWQRPDQFIMNKEEYIRFFPHDEYDNESDYLQWEKAEKVYSQSGTTNESGKWSLAKDKLYTPGKYMVEITTTDKNGEIVKDVQYMELQNEQANQLHLPAYVWHSGSKTVEPGETATVRLGSSANNLFIVQKTDRPGSKEKEAFHFIKLNKEIKDFTFTPTEADRGNFGASWIFVKHNRFYSVNQTIIVPWSNKDLAIEYKTFRDKTEPGSEEKWTVKLSGYKKEKVAAELLGSMYDASLDQFYPHQWYKPSVWHNYYPRYNWSANRNFESVSSLLSHAYNEKYLSIEKKYDYLFFDEETRFYRDRRIVVRGMASMQQKSVAMDMAPAPPMAVERAEEEMMQKNSLSETVTIVETDNSSSQESTTKIRTNFNETAFFLPELKTDEEGNIEFSFTLPDALTKWKFQALAHTKDASFGYSSKDIITQKELMVQPNPTRFVRQGDKIEFSAKIANISDKNLSGTATLLLFDASTNQPVDGLFKNGNAQQSFTVAAGQSTAVLFPIEIPVTFNEALTWRIVAKADNFSDGEENNLSVLTNRMLVTETLPLWLRSESTKKFSFDKLLQSGKSNTLQHHALTVEYTANPAWYAVQALPYLMEYPYECAEQNWNRYYANALASHITNASPKIREVFEKWKTTDTDALLSNLQKNEELKNILLEETPWVMQAKNEAEQKKNIALLFDLVKMSEQLNSTFNKLKKMQSSNGGFVWFSGGPDDRYITQYIVTGIGHLMHLNAVPKGEELNLTSILKTAIPYLDKKLKEDYDYLVKNKVDLSKYTPGYSAIQYLYMRSFFAQYPISNDLQEAYTYFMERSKKTWNKQSKYMQGMMALALHRSNDKVTPAAILKSLKQTAITHKELGMYWKELANRTGWFWYQAPIETQALMIEVFSEVGNDTKTVDNLKTWLLKNKQTNNWKTTTATAEACYALLLQGSDWLIDEPQVKIQLGHATISSTDNKTEAGTGYFKKSIEGDNVTPSMGNISVNIQNNTSTQSAPSTWGGVYWQYFEEMDKITFAETPLQLNKKLFIEKNSDRGPVLQPINEGDVIKIGDKVTVRIELRVDRDMEYVHMKDMRAAALEPINVLSGYRWQGGLGYYETTKDASTNFFFNHLRKGTYVFEYSLFASHSGNFSNGITTIQSMYAPEFTSHSEGVRITIQ